MTEKTDGVDVACILENTHTALEKTRTAEQGQG